MACLLEELSRSGARLLMDTPFAPGTRLRFEVPGTAVKSEGEVVFSRAIESPLKVRFSIGVRLQPVGQPWKNEPAARAKKPARSSAA